MLQTLGPIPAFSVERICAHLSELRGRPLHLLPLPDGASAAGACGLWLATEEGDYVFFEQQTSRPHQEHIVLHEIGHMLFDHPTLELPGAVVPSARLGDLDLTLVRHLLARTDYTTRQEQEAEMLASLIRTVAARAEDPRPSGSSGEWEAALGLSRVR
ncbi:hypothetical protein [Saccharothrix sp. ST-888]|uniref:hypothetical protein n=1 Tax=Saccharothrix sp. ST-888 TaxID=1427391 RepID=UPI0012E02836|nr:hypothetical protein [Saccharothrix sp. ST-888]